MIRRDRPLILLGAGGLIAVLAAVVFFVLYETWLITPPAAATEWLLAVGAPLFIPFAAARLDRSYQQSVDPMLLLGRYVAGQDPAVTLWQLADLIAEAAGSPVGPGDERHHAPEVVLAA